MNTQNSPRVVKKQFPTTPVKIMFLLDSLRMGGAERITVELLNKLDPAAWVPLLVIVNRKGDSPLRRKITNAQVRIIDLNSRRLLDIAAFRRLLSIISLEDVRLVHAQLQDATIMSACASIFKRLPFVVTRHLLQDDESNWRRRMRNRTERLVIRKRASRLISVSEAAMHSYIGETGISAGKCVTIYNGIDPDLYSARGIQRTFRNTEGIPDDSPLIIMVGVIREGKGHALAIEAVSKLNEVHLAIVGDGDPELKAQLQNMAAPNKERIHFLGQRLDIPEILGESDIFILPSYSEALPTVLLEAGAASLPCISSDVGGCREIIVHEKTGLLIEPGKVDRLVKALEYLLSDMGMAREMGKNGEDRVKKLFSSQRQVQQLTSLYKEVLEENLN